MECNYTPLDGLWGKVFYLSKRIRSIGIDSMLFQPAAFASLASIAFELEVTGFVDEEDVPTPVPTLAAVTVFE